MVLFGFASPSPSLAIPIGSFSSGKCAPSCCERAVQLGKGALHCLSLGCTRNGMCHHPVSQGLSSWGVSHLRWQVWMWGMWLRSSPATGTVASLHGRDLPALLVSIYPRKWHLGHISMCLTYIPALHQPSSLPFPLCQTGTQPCAPSSSSPSAGDALASSFSWLWSL